MIKIIRNITVIAILILIFVNITSILSIITTNIDTVTDTVTAIAAIAAAVTTAYLAYLANKTIKQKEEIDTINNTIAFEDKYLYNNVLSSARKSYDDVFAKNESCRKCEIKGSAHCNYKSNCHEFVFKDLNALESVANGVYYEAYHSDYLYCSLNDILQKRFNEYIPLILTLLNTKDKNGDRIYTDSNIKLCWLMLKWAKDSPKCFDVNEQKRLDKTYNLINTYIKDTCRLNKKNKLLCRKNNNTNEKKQKKLDDICEHLCLHHYKYCMKNAPSENSTHSNEDASNFKQCFGSTKKEKCWMERSDEPVCKIYRFK